MATQCFFFDDSQGTALDAELIPTWVEGHSNTLILNQLNSVMIGQIEKMLQLVYSRVRVQEMSPTPISKDFEFLPTQ